MYLYTIFLNFLGHGGAPVTSSPLAGGAAGARPAVECTVDYILN